MTVLYMLTICLVLVDISFARHKSSWSVVSPFLNHHASTSSRLLQSNDENISVVYNQVSGSIVSHSKERYINEALYKVATTYYHGSLDSSISDDTHITSSPSLSTNLESLLSIRGGASSSSNNNNAIQSIIKSILDFPSLPSPIKQIIEMICQFIESISGLKVLPFVEKKKKTKSKAKKSSSSSSSSSRSREKKEEEEVRVEEASVSTKKRKKKRSSSNQKSKEVEVVEEASETTSDDDEPQEPIEEEEAPVKKKASTKPKRPDVASQKFLSNNLKSSNPNYRIQRELKEFIKSPPPGLSVKISGKNVRLWIITLTMPENTVYANEVYKLRVQFPNDYPTSPPSVYFLSPTPRHEHVYTNGDICLSLLGKDWRPIMTASSIAGSIMSILCGAQRKSLPMDNARHAGNKPGLKQDDWVYHDDNC